MAAIMRNSSCLVRHHGAARMPVRGLRVIAKASVSDNGKQSLEDINTLIGKRIKEAAKNVGVTKVWQANAAVGKYVKQAAADAATGKLKPKVAKASR